MGTGARDLLGGWLPGFFLRRGWSGTRARLATMALFAADEMVAVFRDYNVPREALAAVLLFQEAAHREAATAELAREVAASISRAREAG